MESRGVAGKSAASVGFARCMHVGRGVQVYSAYHNVVLRYKAHK